MPVFESQDTRVFALAQGVNDRGCDIPDPVIALLPADLHGPGGKGICMPWDSVTCNGSRQGSE
jgi:hypothetical protein